jgi:hypothetical protein
MVSVGSFEKVALNILLKGLEEVLLIADIDIESREGLFSGVTVGAVLADLLIGKRATHHFANNRRIFEHFEGFVYAIHETVEELKSIMLLPQVHWFSPQPAKPKAT